MNTSELQVLQGQMADALNRLQHLEEEIKNGADIARWQFLVARPHAWRRQLCVKGTT